MAKAKAVKKIKVTMVRSVAGREPRTIRTMDALGLTRIGRTKELPVNRSVIGMLKSVSHLITVEECR